MSENQTETTAIPEELMEKLQARLMWLFVNVAVTSTFVLIETILFNKGCTL